MADFGFVGASYTAPSIYQDDQECINWRPEIDPTKGQGARGVVALYPTPGLTNVVTLQNAQVVRGMRTVSGGNYCVAVCGPYVYVLNSTFVPTIIGQLTTTTGQVGITDNGLNVYIVDGTNRYTWRISQPSAAVFQGTISGTTLTITRVISGTIAANQALFGIGVPSETVIVSGSGSTWTLNNSTSIATTIQMNSAAVAGVITASISGSTLTVTAVSSGTIYLGQTIQGTNVANNTVVTALGSGTVLTTAISTGGTGYAVNDTVTALGGVYGNSPATYTVASVTVGVATLDTITGGSSYTNGTYNNVQMTYVSGTTATTYPTATIVVSGGAVTSVTLTTPGTGFTNTTTVLSANASTIGGTGSGFSVPVKTLTTTGTALTLNTTYSGQYTSLPSNPVSTSSTGSGTGLTLNCTFGTGTGNTGNYVVSGTQTVSSETMYLLNFSVLPSSDGAFTGASAVDIVDNYFIYNCPNTQQWAASNILSPITYGLSYASKFTGPDNLVSLVCDHGQVYLLGETTTEVWADQGTFPFAFQRIPGSSSQHGLAAKFSISRLGNSFAYVAKNNRGQAEIVVMNGYFPQRISTHAVENTLVNQDISDAVAYTYQLEGHECYVITFPNLDITWVYDMATQLWHKWLWIDNQNNYHRHRSNCSAFFQNVVLVGDWQSGQIYKLDPQNFTDDGNTIRRLRRCPHLTTDLQRQYFDELQIQFQPGVGTTGLSNSQGNVVGTPLNIDALQIYNIAPNDNIFIGLQSNINYLTSTSNPQAMLRWSSDGGSTWSNEHWSDIGKTGKYRNRIIWRRLGWARDRVYEVVVTDPINAVIVSANLKASAGEN